MHIQVNLNCLFIVNKDGLFFLTPYANQENMNSLPLTIPILNELRKHYKAVRDQTLTLCAPLKTEDFVVQPIEDVSPPKWHLGHTTWFFENFVLKPFKNDYTLFSEDYSFVFNSYYESVGSRVIRTNRGNLTRPSVDEIFQYRSYVDAALVEFLEEDITEKTREIIILGLQHEQQHQELLIYDIKYILGNNPLFPSYHPVGVNFTEIKSNTGYLDEQFISIEEGIYEIGQDGSEFCFDNEMGKHKVFLHAFQVQNRLITNGEYLAFMEAGGYEKFQYWLSDGWEWVKSNCIKAPLYWHQVDNEWQYYTLEGIKKINLSAPVSHISFYEADAFANWKGKRLLTEFEWEVACKILSPSISKEANFMEQGFFEPVVQQLGNLQFYGDAWEWTSSAYRPYPFFKTAEGALGEYNGKFMINQMVLRGGSCATPRDHIRPTYRNFFQPHLRWQITGLRLAQNI